MKINYESNSSERMYRIVNVIRKDDDLYLVANDPEGKLFAVNLRANLFYGPYTTMDDLYYRIGDEDDVLTHTEVNGL